MTKETRNRVPCTGCSLLCDDITVDVNDGTVATVHNACLRGSGRFHFSSSKDRLRGAWIKDHVDGKARDASMDEAIDACKALLAGARAPVIVGLAKVTSEAQAILVDVARRCKATVAIDGFAAFKHLQAAVARHGISTSTLGESINNADMLVFWGANVVDRAPKLLVKALFSRGRYRQTGKEGKRFAVVDDHHTPTMERADIKIDTGTFPRNVALGLLAGALERAGVVKPEDASEVKALLTPAVNEGDIPREIVQAVNDLATTMKDAEYPVLYLGEKMLGTGNGDGFLDAMLALAAKTRLSIVPVFYSTNITGAFQETCLSGETPSFVDLHELERDPRQHDVILAFGSDFISKLPVAVVNILKDANIVAIDYKESPTTRLARIVIPTCIGGVEAGGIAIRFDGVAIRLDPPVAAPDTLLDDVQVATRLRDA